MRKNTILRTGCILLCCMSMVTGCSAFSKLEQPYELAERAAFLESGLSSGKAESFAHDLCVITDDTPAVDSSLTAEAAAVFDVTDGSAIFGRNAFERLYPASVTKVMTALLAVKYGNLADEVTVTEDAVITESGATLCGIKPGDKLTMEELLYGLMLPSGNDAGAAIAVHMDGSMEKFAERMNEEAKSLGATGSHFVNPHGLNDDNHYTTAYDLYLIFNEAMKYPDFMKVIGEKSYTAEYTDAEGKAVTKTWKATNWYMTGERQMPEGLTVLGGKTGTTKAAGNCLILGSEDKNGGQYISVVLKAPDRKGLYENMTNILNKIVD